MTSNELVGPFFTWLFSRYIIRKNANYRIRRGYTTLGKLINIANKLFFLLV